VHFVLIVADRLCLHSSQDRDQPWRLPAEYPNSLLLVNRGFLLSPAHALLAETIFINLIIAYVWLRSYVILVKIVWRCPVKIDRERPVA
jgi:hypothetical protein